MAWSVAPLFGPVVAVTTISLLSVALVVMHISTLGSDSMTVVLGPILNSGTVVCVCSCDAMMYLCYEVIDM